MALLPLLLGSALILFTLFDALWTTLAPHGAGPVTKGLARGLWTLALGVHRAMGGAHRLLSVVGPALLFLAFLWWVAGLWGGWLMVFASSDGAIHAAQSGEPADLASRAYFVGFTLFTMGNGDYVPSSDGWELATAVASLSGLFVVTLALTYLVPVVSAVAGSRKLAAHLSDLGDSPASIVNTAWAGSAFDSFDQHLAQTVAELEMHTQRHFAYPVLHYFHSTERRTAAGPAIAAFAEALRMLDGGVAPGARPAPAVLVPARRAVRGYLAMLREGFVSPAAEAPPLPDLGALDGTIPTLDAEAFEAAVHADDAERRLLLALAQDTGWDWGGLVPRSGLTPGAVSGASGTP